MVKVSSSPNRHGLSIRGDAVYCPLPLSIDVYQNCLVDCWHCYMRRLNHIWGKELRPLNIEALERKLVNGLKNKNPKSSLAHCLALKKTFRIGNKADAFQPIEGQYHITREVLKLLEEMEWSYVIQTRFLSRVWEYEELTTPKCAVILPVVSPGLEKDWEVLERGKTDHPKDRMSYLSLFAKRGYHCGVNGEPFIPGYHTPDDFREALRFIKSYGITRYNTYNLHMNDFVIKRLHKIGLDIEKIWEMNQDKHWGPIQKQLCTIAKEEGVILGCPDFVNTGKEWVERANTCCGIDVPSPSLFNTHCFKQLIQMRSTPEEILERTWEGIGDYAQGEAIIKGKSSEFYTMVDAGLVQKKKRGLIK